LADARIIARLVESQEFASLKEYFADAKNKEYADLARELFNNPSDFDPLDLAEKRGFHKGVESVLATPQKLAAKIHRKERL
jgi:hypothetical protein